MRSSSQQPPGVVVKRERLQQQIGPTKYCRIFNLRAVLLGHVADNRKCLVILFVHERLPEFVLWCRIKIIKSSTILSRSAELMVSGRAFFAAYRLRNTASHSEEMSLEWRAVGDDASDVNFPNLLGFIQVER